MLSLIEYNRESTYRIGRQTNNDSEQQANKETTDHRSTDQLNIAGSASSHSIGVEDNDNNDLMSYDASAVSAKAVKKQMLPSWFAKGHKK